MADHVTGSQIEQRALLRVEPVPGNATIAVRGGSDTRDKLRRHAERTARAWSLDGKPFFRISVFAVLDTSLDDLLGWRFANFRAVYLPTAATLAGHGFELVPTGQRPHFTLRLRGASDHELDRLLAALGDLRLNPQYAKGSDHEEYRNVPRGHHRGPQRRRPYWLRLDLPRLGTRPCPDNTRRHRHRR